MMKKFPALALSSTVNGFNIMEKVRHVVRKETRLGKDIMIALPAKLGTSLSMLSKN